MKCIYYGSWHFSWNMLDISVWNSTTSGKNHYCLITTCYSDDSKKKYITCTSTKNRLCSLGKPLMFNAVPYNTWISKCMIYRSKHGLILCFRGIFSTDMFAFLVYKTVVNSEELVIAQRNKQDATHHLRRYVPGPALIGWFLWKSKLNWFFLADSISFHACYIKALITEQLLAKTFFPCNTNLDMFPTCWTGHWFFCLSPN